MTLIEKLVQMGVDPMVANKIAKEAQDGIDPSGKNEVELMMAITLNPALQEMFAQTSKDGVNVEQIAHAIMDTLKGDGEDQILISSEFEVNSDFPQQHEDDMKELPSDKSFVPADALDGFDAGEGEYFSEPAPRSKPKLKISTKQIFLLAGLLMVVAIFFVWKMFFLPVLVDIQTSKVAKKNNIPFQHQPGYSNTSDIKHATTIKYKIPPKNTKVGEVKTEKPSSGGGKAPKYTVTPPSSSPAKLKNNKGKIAERKPSTPKINVTDREQKDAPKKQHKHKIAANVLPHQAIAEKRPWPHHPLVKTSRGETSKTETIQSSVAMENIDTESNNGGVCNVAKEYVGHKYVYFIQRGKEYVPAFRNPNWDNKGVLLERRMVVVHSDDEAGYVDIGKGHYLPVEFFSSCSVF